MSEFTTAAAYVRMSSDQQERSPRQQREDIERFASENGYRIPADLWFEDLGLSGTDTNRPALQNMLSQVDDGRIKVVLVYKLDRITRLHPDDFAPITKRLRSAGCQLLSVTELGIDVTDDEFGWLFAGMSSQAARAYAKSVSLRSLKGRIDSTREGRWVSNVPFGYGRTDDMRLIVNESQAGIVRRIFRRYVDGKSWAAVAEELNADGIPSARGGHWTGTAVRRILENHAYRGHTCYGRTATGKFCIVEGGRLQQVRQTANERRESAEIIVPDTHEPIISEQLWNASQQAAQARKSDRARPHTKAIRRYAGMLVCCNCGATLQVSGRDKYAVYVCSRWGDGTGRCSGTVVREREVDPVFRQAIVDVATDPEVRTRTEREIRRLVRSSNDTATTSPKRSQQQLRQAEARLAKAEANLLHLDPDMLQAGQRNIRQLRATVSELKAKARTKPAVDPEQLVGQAFAVLDDLAEAVATADSAEFNRLMRGTFGKVVAQVETRQVSSTRRRHELKGFELLASSPTSHGPTRKQ